jgi:hypothetical protein
MSGGDEGKLPPVDHDPLNEGAVIKSVIFDIYYLIKILVTSNCFLNQPIKGFGFQKTYNHHFNIRLNIGSYGMPAQLNFCMKITIVQLKVNFL